MRTPTALPSFIQIGAGALALVQTASIIAITAEKVPVTDRNREYYKGCITPEGLACRLTLEVCDGQPLSFPCNEEVLHSTMAQFSAALQAHVIIGGMGNVERAQRRSRADTAR